MSLVRRLRDSASGLLCSPRRRAAAAAALVAVLTLDAYLLHARSPGASGGAAERRHGGQPTLREPATARDRSQAATSSPDEPSSPEYAWPVPNRPATHDQDAVLEPPPSAGQPQVSEAPQKARPSSPAPARPMSPLGPTSPPSPISRLQRVSPPPPSPLPAPPLPPSDNAGRSGKEEDEAAAAGASSGGTSGASAGAATFPEGAPGNAGLPPEGPRARPPTPAEPDADTAPPPPSPEPSSAFPPIAHPAIPGSMRPPRAGDLNGSWEIQNVISFTSYPAYRGLRLTYRIVLHQDGERISGDGEKWAENGRRIPAAQRTPIHLSGEMVGREVRVRFTESGSRRDSAGSFRWRLSADGTGFAGTFASSAAAARGASAAVRLP